MLMLHPKHARPVFVSYPRYLEQITWPVLDAGFLLITTKSKIVCSIPHRIFCSGCSEDSKPAHTNSSLSHECASDGSLFRLTPTLVVAICAKVSPCSFSKRPQTPASCPFSFHCCSLFGVLTSQLVREICKRHAIMAAGFFLPSFNNPYGLQISAQTLRSCSWHIYWHKVHVSVCQLPEGQDLSLINWPGWHVGRCRFSHLWYGVQEKHFWCALQSLSSLS